MHRPAAGYTFLELLVVVALLGVTALLSSAALANARERGGQSKCSNNLKQIGLAANQHADDRHYFPHKAALKELDGDYTTDTSARAFRTLIYYAYLDCPETYICPSSADAVRPLDLTVKTDLRLFSWTGVAPLTSAATCSPLYDAQPAGDEGLDKMVDLSYGYTRRCYGANNDGSNLLAADRARICQGTDCRTVDWVMRHQGNLVGNHKDCMLAVHLDAHVSRITPTGDGITTYRISAADPTGGKPCGFLAVLGDDCP